MIKFISKVGEVMLCSKEEIKVYEGVNNRIQNQDVLPYEDELIEFLNTHSDDNESSYMDKLCSYRSIGLDYRFSRYLLLYLEKFGGKLIDGRLDAFTSGKFNHCWVEVDDSVYDTTFIGKWNKDDYYSLFGVTQAKEVDVDNDVDFKIFKSKNHEFTPEEVKPLSYFDWYSYQKNNTISVFPLSESLKIVEFQKGYTRKLTK